MSEWGDIAAQSFGQQRSNAQNSVSTSVEDNPDDAARAVDLAQASGVPSSVIYNNMDAFQRLHKAQLSNQIVQANPQLTSYVNAHPMAARVSNDDWAQQDTISRSLNKLNVDKPEAGWVGLSGRGPGPLASIGKAVSKGFWEGANLEEIPEEYHKLYTLVDTPFWRTGITMLSPAIVAGLGFQKAFTGAAVGASAGIGEAYKMAGGDILGAQYGMTGDRLVRDLFAFSQVAMGEAGSPYVGGSHAWMVSHQNEIARAAHVAVSVKPFVDHGFLPPGLFHEVDQAIKTQTDLDFKNFDGTVREIQKAATQERSPEMQALMVRQHVGDATIGVSAAAIRRIYGDEQPSLDDGKLGWVPHIAEQLAAAEKYNGDVEVPLADMLTKTDRDTIDKISEDIRVRADGLTKNEAKDLEPPEGETSSDPVEAVRKAAGLQPLEAAGKRLTLGPRTTDAEGFHTFDLLDEKGESQGQLVVSETKDPKVLSIEDIYSSKGFDQQPFVQRGSFGPRLVKQLANQIREQFPGVEKVTGIRASGARIAAKGEAGTERVTIDLPKPMAERQPFATAPLGQTVKRSARYLDLIEKVRYEDEQATAEKIKKRETQRQSATWKENSAAMRPEVVKKVQARPDVQAFTFFRDGVLHGVERPGPKPRLRTESLTKEQQEALSGYHAKGGIDPDDLAGEFGYASGTQMVDALARIVAEHRASKRNAAEFTRKLIDEEVERQMEAKYGTLQENVMEATKDQVYSQNQGDLFHEDTHYIAEVARLVGHEVELPLTQEALRAGARRDLAEIPLSAVKSNRLMVEGQRVMKALEDAWLKGDVVEAYKLSQYKERIFWTAKEMQRIEKERADFAKTAKRFVKRDVANFPHDFARGIHEILLKLGMKVNRDFGDIATEWEKSGEKSFQAWVDRRNREGKVDGTNIPVSDYFMRDDWRAEYSKLTVSQFEEIKQTVDALVHQGRAEEKWKIGQEKQDRKDWIHRAEVQLAKKFPMIQRSLSPGIVSKVGDTARMIVAAVTNIETFVARLDGRDPRGMFTRTIAYPSAESANHEAVLHREFAQIFRSFDEVDEPNKLLDPPFMDPDTGRPFKGFTRKNLEALVANIGNPGNLKALTDWLKIDPALLMKWIEQNTTLKDIQRAQMRGNAFGEAWERYQNVERNVNGIASKSIELGPFSMHGENFEGWYHPIIDDPERSPMRLDPEEEAHEFWPTTPTGFTKERTGAKHAINLNIDMVPAKLAQVLHGIAFKEVVHDLAKIFRDKEFQKLIRNRYGLEYVEELNTWLQDIAGSASFDTALGSKAERISNYLRQNAITTYIAFNPGTIQKHAGSAFGMSAKEVGLVKQLKLTGEVGLNFMYHAVTDLFSKDPYLSNTLWNFVRENSEEIQRRNRNWQETLMGAHDVTFQKTSWRNTVAQWGSYGVALSDMVSAVPLWLAKYREAFEEYGDRGPAVEEANRAVRRAHGSTAITNLPRAVRRAGPLGSWMTSIYGFWGTVMQRRIELMHDLNDVYHFGLGKDINESAKTLRGLGGSIIAYYIWPAFVADTVAHEFLDDKRPYWLRAAIGLGGTAADSMLYLRDIYYGLEHGEVAAPGLAGGPLGDFHNLVTQAMKKRPLSKQNAGKLIQDTITFAGDMTGLAPKAVGSAVRYGVDVQSGKQRPRGPGDIYRGVVSGSQKLRVVK